MNHSSFLTHIRIMAFALTTLSVMQPATASDEPLVKAQTIVVDHSLPHRKVNAQILAARRYGTFWNTGNAAFARAALAPEFTDQTPPPGRAQGLAGPLAASKMMRAAIPDMTCEIEQMMVTGDRVIVHLRFHGHFTGQFNDTTGQGQAINFIATDIYKVTNGLITDNWHIEDNLTFLQQIGIVHG